LWLGEAAKARRKPRIVGEEGEGMDFCISTIEGGSGRGEGPEKTGRVKP